MASYMLCIFTSSHVTNTVMCLHDATRQLEGIREPLRLYSALGGGAGRAEEGAQAGTHLDLIKL